MVNHSQRKYIGSVRHDNPVLARSQYLRSNVAWGTAFFVKKILFSDPAGETEVSDNIGFGVIGVNPDHDVLQLEVTMHNSFLSQMLDTFSQVPDSLEPALLALQFVLP